MPTADAILHTLATMASDLVVVAIAWHVAFAVGLLALLLGWRPTPRTCCILLSAPILSVAVAAFAYGSWFNAISFTVLALALAVLGEGLVSPRLARGPAWTLWLGIAAVGFGLAYPHFVAGPWYAAFVAAPVGVVPCPTLSVVGGLAVVAGGLGSRALPALLAVWLAFYAWFGIAKLGVALDVGLVFALVGLIAIRVQRGAARAGSARWHS